MVAYLAADAAVSDVVQVTVIRKVESLAGHEAMELRVPGLDPMGKLVKGTGAQHLRKAGLAGRALCDIGVEVPGQTAGVVGRHLAHGTDAHRPVLKRPVEEAATTRAAEGGQFEARDEFGDGGDVDAEDLVRPRHVDSFAVAAEAGDRVEEGGGDEGAAGVGVVEIPVPV